MNDLVREHEQQLREDQQQHEEEVEMVKLELAHTIEESKQVIAQYENELSLLNQTNEAVNKYYSETKETLDR
jgi:DNA-binding XRE family transcriptional regulator